MDEEEAGKSPQKDEDAEATIPASKTPPKENHEESNTESVAETNAELHNGSEHVSSEEVENAKETTATPEAEEEQDPDHSVNSGSEKWKLHLDISDSASTTTDNEGSEAEDKCDESRENVVAQKIDDTSKNAEREESDDFRGFEISASNAIDQLKKLLDEAEEDLIHSFGDSDTDTEGQETTDVVSSSSKATVVQKDFEEVSIGDQKVRFTFRLVDKSEVTDEDDDESTKVVTAENSDVSRDVDDSMDETSRDGRMSTAVKQQFQSKVVEEEDASSMEVTSQMDSQFDGRKFTNDISSEVTSSADVASSAKSDSGAAMEDLTVSEVTSSATSSPSVSSRSSQKLGGAGGRRSQGDSPALSGGSRGKKLSIDLSNPAFRKPLELGWKRELVYRNTSEASSKKMADIYYYTPLGKKVRSNREVLEHLSGMDLTLDNFTFFKEPLGIDDPTKEIIRDAKKITMKDPSATPVKKTPKSKTTPSKLQEMAIASPITAETSTVEDSKIQEKSQEPQEPSTPKSTTAPVTTPSESKITTKVKGSNAKVKKLPYSRIAPKPSKDSSKSGETEMGMLPPWWCPKKTGDGSDSLSLTTNKPGSAAWSEKVSQPPAKRLKTSATKDEQHFMQLFMTNLCAGYSSMLHVFQYLKVQELLRAARVCRMWRDLAAHPSLWQTVRMKNSQVVDWKGFAESLQRRGTQHLDLRKMLVPGDDTEHMWDEFCRHIGLVTSLSALDLCRCPSRVVESIATTCPQLKIINALAIKCDTINLSVLGSLKNLQELRLKSLSGIVLTSTLVPLKHLTGLKHLSLTTFKDLGKKDPTILGSLKNLESLELGECCDMPEKFGPEALSQLKKLERLRLEKGQGKSCPTFSILRGVCMLPKLTHLELINFDVKPGFDEALAQCTNIRRLLIIPTYVTQSATTNHMVLNGVNQLRNTLTHFVWGITHELLRVTELFVDQCEGQKDKSTSGAATKGSKKFQGGDSIPILKPAEGSLLFVSPKDDAPEDPSGESKSAGDAASGADESKDEADDKTKAPQVEILPLPKLQKFLTSSLPKTKVQILKIPFHATWRQNISETTS